MKKAANYCSFFQKIKYQYVLLVSRAEKTFTMEEERNNSILINEPIKKNAFY